MSLFEVFCCCLFLLSHHCRVSVHSGWFTLTMGQRAKIGGQKDALFVVDKDITTGDVFVVSQPLCRRLPRPSGSAFTFNFSSHSVLHVPLWFRHRRPTTQLSFVIQCGPTVSTGWRLTLLLTWSGPRWWSATSASFTRCLWVSSVLLLRHQLPALSEVKQENICPLCVPAPCTVTLNIDGSVWISLSQPLRALTPGQVIASLDVNKQMKLWYSFFFPLPPVCCALQRRWVSG